MKRSFDCVARQEARWTLSTEDKGGGVLEGVSVTRFWRFKDDFVVRLTEDEDGVRVDMRSRSRIGKGDLGVNAARIHDYFEAVAGISDFPVVWMPLQPM